MTSSWQPDRSDPRHHQQYMQQQESEFTSTEVVYGVTGTDVTELPEYGVSP